MKTEISDYWLSDKPVPPMPCTQDLIYNVEVSSRAIAAMLGGAPMDLFEWHPVDDEALRNNLRSLERWESRQEEKRKDSREAKPPNDTGPKGSERDRALGILTWAEDRLAAKTEGDRDDKTTDAIYFLGKFVNDGHLTPNEVEDTIIRASQTNKHYPENKSINQIQSDVNRGLAKAATDGVHVDWDEMDRWTK